MCTGFYLFPFTSCVDTFLLLKKQNDQNTLEASDFPQFIWGESSFRYNIPKMSHGPRFLFCFFKERLLNNDMHRPW